MDHQQAINLGLVKAFADRGLAFAFPTQTVLLRPSSVDVSRVP